MQLRLRNLIKNLTGGLFIAGMAGTPVLAEQQDTASTSKPYKVAYLNVPENHYASGITMPTTQPGHTLPLSVIPLNDGYVLGTTFPRATKELIALRQGPPKATKATQHDLPPSQQLAAYMEKARQLAAEMRRKKIAEEQEALDNLPTMQPISVNYASALPLPAALINKFATIKLSEFPKEENYLPQIFTLALALLMTGGGLLTQRRRTALATPNYALRSISDYFKPIPADYILAATIVPERAVSPSSPFSVTTGTAEAGATETAEKPQAVEEISTTVPEDEQVVVTGDKEAVAALPQKSAPADIADGAPAADEPIEEAPAGDENGPPDNPESVQPDVNSDLDGDHAEARDNAEAAAPETDGEDEPAANDVAVIDHTSILEQDWKKVQSAVTDWVNSWSPHNLALKEQAKRNQAKETGTVYRLKTNKEFYKELRTNMASTRRGLQQEFRAMAQHMTAAYEDTNLTDNGRRKLDECVQRLNEVLDLFNPAVTTKTHRVTGVDEKHCSLYSRKGTNSYTEHMRRQIDRMAGPKTNLA